MNVQKRSNLLAHSEAVIGVAQGIGIGALLSVVWSALVGSAHCAGMCGPLALGATGGSGWGILRYQLGRGLSYGFLGVLAGGVGQSVWGTTVSRAGNWVWLGLGVMLLSSVFGPLLLGRWTTRRARLGIKSYPRFSRVMQRLPRTPFWIGLGSAFLPCGYLHAFLAGALMTGSAILGGLWMVCVALGTAPGLFAGTLLTRELQKRSPVLRPRWLAPLLLVASGVWSLYHFGQTQWGRGGGHAHSNHALPEAYQEHSH